MRFVRSNTATIITVGPFYDRTDGVTIETALTITNERITLTADTDAGSAPTNILDNIAGATSGTANDLNYITGNDAGMMQLELAAADVNRLGRMFLSITDAANHVPVFHELTVLPQPIYDWLIAGTITLLPTNTTQISGDTTAADNAEAFFDGTGYAGTGNTIPTVTTVGTLTTYTGNTVQTGDVFPLVSTEIADIKAKTDALPPDPADQSLLIAATDAIMTRLGVAGAGLTALGDTRLANLDATVSSRATQTSVDDVPTNAELATALATADDAVLTQVALVKAKTDNLTFTVATVLDANVQRINDVPLTGDGSATPFGV